jgi:hypothetical protein
LRNVGNCLPIEQRDLANDFNAHYFISALAPFFLYACHIHLIVCHLSVHPYMYMSHQYLSFCCISCFYFFNITPSCLLIVSFPSVRKEKFTLEQAMKAQRSCRGMAPLFLFTSSLDESGRSAPRPGRFTVGKETRHPLYRRLGGTPWQVRTGAGNLAPTESRSPDCRARSEPLYRLRYLGSPVSLKRCKFRAFACHCDVLITATPKWALSFEIRSFVCYLLDAFYYFLKV